MPAKLIDKNRCGIVSKKKISLPSKQMILFNWIVILVLVTIIPTGTKAGFACLSNPCIFGVCIDGLNSTYSCYCIDGYTGVQCQTNWDECWSSPCTNGGSCVDGVAFYNCTCPEGFTGINCEENVDECLSNPCQNEGLCRDGDNGYVCTCHPGYLGIHCEIDVAVCELETGVRCRNGGECIEGPGLKFSCKCPSGWKGQICEEEINECESSPCQNGGVCVDKLASYVCACPMGYTGINCEEEILICANSPCQNNALCLMEENYPTCYCVPDYHGERCEFQYDECQLGPKCVNGGVCIDGVDTFTCSCPPMLTGLLCECLILENDNYDCNYTRKYFSSTTTTTTTTTTTVLPSVDVTKLYPEDKYTTEKYDFSYSDEDISSFSTELSSEELTKEEKYEFDTSTVKSVYIPITIKSKPTTIYKTTIWPPYNYDYTTHKSIHSPNYTRWTTVTLPSRDIVTLPVTPKTTIKNPTHEYQETTTISAEYIDYDYETTTNIPELTITTVPSVPVKLPSSLPSLTTTTTISPFFTEQPDISFSTRISDINKNFGDTTISQTTNSYKENETKETTSYSLPPTLDVPIMSLTTPKFSTKTTIPTQTTISSSYWPLQPSFRPTSPPFSLLPDDATKSLYTDDLITYPTVTIDTSPTQLPPQITSSTKQFNDSTISIPDCVKIGCYNGGTCVTTSEGSRCVCRFDRQGSHCELPINIKNAAFSGDSYVSHRIHKNIPHQETLESILPIHVELKVRTRATNGLIMLAAAQGSKAGHYMALFLQKGLLQFQFSCGLQTMLLSELETPVNTGHEIIIRAELNFSRNLTHCNASLLVNETLTMSGDQPTWLKLISPRMHTVDLIQNTWLHLGGAPQAPIGLIIELPPTQSGTGFTGCLHSLRINGIERDIFGDALDGFGITECGSLACLSSPCRNGAACIKIDSNESDDNNEQKQEKWKCKCPTGYMGPTCEISVCEDNPCQYGGTCVQFPGSGYLCLCPLGKHGHYCEHNLEVALPSFSGSVNGLSSFVAYTVPIPLEYSLELSFKILPQTMSQISLLAFLGQNGYHDEKSDHLAVSFIQGYIMLTWNLGGGPRRIFTQKPIDFRLDAPRVPYEIKIGRIGRQAWLSVDGKFNITGRSPGSVTRMDVVPILYLGGHEIANFNTLPHDLPLHSGFQGCIYDISLKAGQVSVPLQETRGVRGRGVGQCGTRECHRHACQHDGACLQHGATFTCICQEGWYGPLCAQSLNPCDSFNNKCHDDATCVPLVNGYECDCPIGKTGKNCNEAIQSLSDVSLTGRRSYLAVRWPNLGSDRVEKIGSKRSQLVQYRNFTKKIVTKPITYSPIPGQHFVMKLLNEVEKQRNFSPSPLMSSPTLDEQRRVQFFYIEFQVRPLSERGLLLYFGTLNNNQDRKIGFVSLSLQGGVVEFRISGPNNHVTVVRSVRMLAIGEWHKIKMAQRGRWLTLWVEGSASSALAPSAEVLVEPDSLLYIGGLKDLSKLPHNAISGFPIPFRGCVRGLVVSGTRLVLNETTILESRNIRDCDGTACGGDSCESGGHCWLDEKLQPHCICPEYAKGERCEYSETCKLISCKNNGRCLRNGRCSCPNGWGGFYCEIAMSKPITPNFRGNSYLVLPPPRIPVKDKRRGPSVFIKPKDTLQISINFSTIDPSGLLLWSAKDKLRFLGIGLEDGHIKLASNLLGNTNSTIDVPAGQYVSDGAWHNIQITIDRGRLQLILDEEIIFSERINITPITIRRGNDLSITYEDLFYIGGFPQDMSRTTPNGSQISQRTNGRFHKPFKGCLQDISFGLDPNGIINDFSNYEGENIGSCELNDDGIVV